MESAAGKAGRWSRGNFDLDRDPGWGIRGGGIQVVERQLCHLTSSWDGEEASGRSSKGMDAMMSVVAMVG